MIVANYQKKSEGASDFRVYAGRAELGAAWKAQTNGEEARDYLSVQLDDPSFPEPIRAALFEDDGATFLVWHRRDGQQRAWVASTPACAKADGVIVKAVIAVAALAKKRLRH